MRGQWRIAKRRAANAVAGSTGQRPREALAEILESKSLRGIRRASRWGFLGLLLLLVLVLGNSSLRACNIPVFRYALENWKPDYFQVLVLSRGPLDETQRALVDRLHAEVNSSRAANLQVLVVDLTVRRVVEALAEESRGKPLPKPELDALESSLAELPLERPRMVVLYPGQYDRLAWSADLTEEAVKTLVDSPARQAVGERLLAGESAVWVLVETGRPEEDQRAWDELTRQLAEAEKKVRLPERELIETDEYYRADVKIDLKVKFSAVRVSASDPAEAAFVSMLRGSEADLAEFDQPLAIPIYGRGRTYFALVGKGINQETISENCQFLCGACSCQVKQDNPGVDMLMAVPWEERVSEQGSAAPPLPQLTGIGALELTAGEVSAEDLSTAAVAPTEDSAGTKEPVAVASDPKREEIAAAAAPGGLKPARETPSNAVATPVPAPASSSAFSWKLVGIVSAAAAVAVAALMFMARGG